MDTDRGVRGAPRRSGSGRREENVAGDVWARIIPVLAGVLGLATAIVGVMAISRAGLDGSLNVPVARAAAFNQSAMVGLGEFAAGLLLVLAALSYATRNLIVAGDEEPCAHPSTRWS